MTIWRARVHAYNIQKVELDVYHANITSLRNPRMIVGNFYSCWNNFLCWSNQLLAAQITEHDWEIAKLFISTTCKIKIGSWIYEIQIIKLTRQPMGNMTISLFKCDIYIIVVVLNMTYKYYISHDQH